MTREILQLTSLRFVAAFYVFVFHVEIHFGLPIDGWLKNFVLQGAVGMSLFFILSGFVLSISYSGGVSRNSQYGVRRFARIAPVYILAAVVTLPWLNNVQNSSGVIFWFQNIFLLFVNLFFLQAWFPPLMSFWNVGASWSVSVEVFFYVFFPWIMWRISGFDAVKLFRLIVLAYIAAVLPGLSLHLISENGFNYYVMPIFRIPEFFIGVCVGIIWSRGFRLPFNFQILSITSIFLVVGLSLVPPKFYVDMNWLVVPGFSVIIFSVASLKNGSLFNILTSRIFVFSGHSSYCFYSLQILFIIIAREYGHVIKIYSGNNGFIFGSLMFLVLYLVSASVYLFFEKPFRRIIVARFEASGSATLDKVRTH